MSDQKVKKGTKITAEEAKTLDRSKMGVGIQSKEPTSDVEGQFAYEGLTECPWCHNIGRTVLDTDVYLWFTCGNCGLPFRA
jgi:hypothetical protein